MASAGQEAHPFPTPTRPLVTCACPPALPGSVWLAAPGEPHGTHIPLPVGKSLRLPHFKIPTKMEKMKLRDKLSGPGDSIQDMKGDALGPTARSAAAPDHEPRRGRRLPPALLSGGTRVSPLWALSCPAVQPGLRRDCGRHPSLHHLSLTGQFRLRGWGPACVSCSDDHLETGNQTWGPTSGAKVSHAGSVPLAEAKCGS